MNYRLTRKELRIIEQTKREHRADGNDTEGKCESAGLWQKIRPYVYFAGIFLGIALALNILLRLLS